MKLSFVLLLACLAVACLAFPTRDLAGDVGPDRNEKSMEDVLIPERELPEQYRRRRNAQMNPGQDPPAESTTQQSGFTIEHQSQMPPKSQGKMTEGSRSRRHDEDHMGQGTSHSHEHESSTKPLSGTMNQETRSRRHHHEGHGQSAESEQPPTSTESQTTPSHPMSEHPVPEEMKPTETRRRRNAQMEIQPRIREPLEKQNGDEPNTPEPPKEEHKPTETRRRRSAQMDTPPLGMNQPPPQPPKQQTLKSTSTKTTSETHTSVRISEEGNAAAAPHSEDSGPEADSLETTAEMPLGEQEAARSGMKPTPVDARRRRYTQAEIVPILAAQQQNEMSTTEQSSTADDNDQQDQMSAETRRRRQLEPGFDALPLPTKEKPLIKGESSDTTTIAISTETPKEHTPESAGSERQSPMDMNHQSKATEDQQPMDGDENPEFPSEQSLEEQGAEDEIHAVETRMRRHAQEPEMAPEVFHKPMMTTVFPASSTHDQASESSSTEDSEDVAPETRRRRHIPIRPIPTEEAESTTEQPSTEEPDSEETQQNFPQGGRQRRYAQGDPQLGVQLGDLTPTGEPEGAGSAYVRKEPPDMEHTEDKTAEEESTTEESLTDDKDNEMTDDKDDETPENHEEDNAGGFWQRKARLWEHLW